MLCTNPSGSHLLILLTLSLTCVRARASLLALPTSISRQMLLTAA